MGILKSILGRKAEEVKQGVTDGAAHVELAVILAEGRKLVNKLIDLSNEVTSAKAAELITDTALAMQAIYDDLEKDPRDVKVAEDFIAYHAPKAVEVIALYVRNKQEKTAKPDELALTEETIQKMKTSFEILLAKCLENDNEGMALQSETLRRILELETPTLRS